MSRPEVSKLENTPRNTTGLMLNARVRYASVRYSSTYSSQIDLAEAALGNLTGNAVGVLRVLLFKFLVTTAHGDSFT